MPVSKFLAFDFGAESGRTIIGSLDDQGIILEEIHRFPNNQIEIGEHFFWDFKYLFQELKNGLHQCVQKGHGNIKSIGIDTWGVDFGFVGMDGELLENPFVYRDSRTDGMMEKVYSSIPREEVFFTTGI